jgi:hypothetical protein
MGIMTTRQLRVALFGLSLSVGAVYVPACEYDPANPTGQPQAPTSTRLESSRPESIHPSSLVARDLAELDRA